MQLGVIGLGRMGANIARRLMKAGHTCVVWDRDQKAVDALTTDGATRSYCSLLCGSGERCPTKFHCEAVAGLDEDESACLNVR